MNKEPDMDYYTIYREDSYGGGWQYLDVTSDNSYEDETLSYCNAPPGASCPDLHTYSYKVTAVDKTPNPNESDPSNVVEARLVGGSPSKIGADNKKQIKPVSYSLGQNYPNPFNPSTSIDYSIKQAGFVTLKIYDMLGKEVAVLVNGNKPAGYYTVEFNGSNLPSGVYIYRLTAGKFSSAKKLMLMK